MSAHSRAFMPLYVGDYLRDTGHLTAAEHGAYLLLLMQAWSRGGDLPADDQRLRTMARMDGKTWARCRETILAFFDTEDGVLRNRRLQSELRAAELVSSKRRDAGTRGAEKRWKNNEAPMANATDLPMAKTCHPQPQPHIENKNPSPSKNEGEGSGKSPDGDPPATEAQEGGEKPPRKPPHPPEAVLLEMAAVWNEVAAAEHGLPSVRELTDRRRQQMRARCRERWTTDPVRQFRAYVTRICQSPFLTGGGSRGWKADFDWALQPSHVIAVAEGKYHDGESG